MSIKNQTHTCNVQRTVERRKSTTAKDTISRILSKCFMNRLDIKLIIMMRKGFPVNELLCVSVINELEIWSVIGISQSKIGIIGQMKFRCTMIRLITDIGHCLKIEKWYKN